MIQSDYLVPSDRGPIEEVAGSFDSRPWRYFEASAEGAALERRYGYLPWLHRVNVCRVVDAHYWESERVLPIFVPGLLTAA